MKILILLIPILSCYLLTSCLKDEPFKGKYNGLTPLEQSDGIELSTPQNENMDNSLLEEAYHLVFDDNRYVMARSLLVFRNGKLVAEAYPNDTNDINMIHNIQSCTKSISSIMVGIAIQDGLIESLDEKLVEIYPEYFDSEIKKQTITIKQALTMQTGLEFDNSKHARQLYHTQDNSIEYVLSQKYLSQSGDMTNYNDGAPQLISKVIEKKIGQTMSSYAREKLFNPLGITDWKWEEAKDGTTFGAFSLFLKPRDLGKIGQLLLQEGKYNSQTIIDKAYLADATSIKTYINFNNEPYGYYFWILPDYEGYKIVGHGGQFLFVSPKEKLVIVYTAYPYTSSILFDESTDLINLVLDSCK